ncbi:peptidase G2 autoproteolytic cleavage domain-containing protein [Brucella pituitosa]|uniref:peptidase G2 autoproteolytic cleavage domain-containing protein n=1 Tax=Brucella pituitosa TaxID=571256 RepID=UPI003C7621E1
MAVRPFDEIFRDFVVNGLPASGPHHPHKADIRDSLNALVAGPFPDNRVIKLNNANTGTENNIVVTASVAIPTAVYQVLYVLNVTQENTGSVTVSGAINRVLVTNTSEPVPAGYLKPGMAVLCIDTGTELRMLSYGDVAAEVEALVDRAEDAAIAAESAAGANLSNLASRAAVLSTNIPSPVAYIRTAGYFTPGDGGAALYKRVASEPVHAGKVQSVDGAWWELVADIPNVLQFGAGAAGSVSDKFIDAVSYAFDQGLEKVFVPDHSYVLNTRVTIPNGVKLDVGAGVVFSGSGDFRLADGTAVSFSLVQGGMSDPTKRTRLETENVIIDSFIGELDTFDQRSDVKQIRKYWDGKVTGDVVHAGALNNQFYDYGSRSISDPATGGISLDTNWARIHSMQYQATGRANEVTPWAVGVDSSNIDGNVVGGSVYNEISFHSAAGTTSNTEKFFAGINMFMGRYSPTGSLSETNRGSAGISIMTLPGGGGFKAFDKAGLTSYPLMAGISLGGWSGQVGVATTPTHSQATAAFETAIKIGGATPTNWLTNPSIRSKIDRGIVIEDHDLVALRVGDKYNSSSTSTKAIVVYAGGGEVLIGSSSSESTAKLEVRQPGGYENLRLSNTQSGYTGVMEVRRTLTNASSAFNFALYQTGSGSDTKFNFRGDGTALCDGSWTGGGADYAEYFEWIDRNPNAEDRVGYSVALEGNKIRIAAHEDGANIIGVISGNPSVVGDSDIDQWKQKYLCDDFGRPVWEEYKIVEWTEEIIEKDAYEVISWTLENGEEIAFPVGKVPKSIIVPDNAVVLTMPPVVVCEERSFPFDDTPSGVVVPVDARTTTAPNKRQKLNPAFDANRAYTSREGRPEWDIVGLMGKLRIRKGQPVNSRWIKMRDVSDTVEEWLVR